MDDDARRMHYTQCIREVYPHLPLQQVRLLPADEGQNNAVLIADDCLVFRFPRYADGVARLPRLVRLLQALHPRVSLVTPDPQYVCLDPPEVGRAFIGYPVIPGEPLWREALDAIGDDATLQRLAAQLATFLKELHAIGTETLEAALPGELARFDPLEKWRDLYARIRAKLFPHMRPDARQSVAEHFEAFLSQPPHRTIAPVLTHGDYGTGNWLYDPRTLRATGVIDFDSAGLGDPALDLAAPSTTPAGFFDHFARAYGVDDALLVRAQFYRGTFVLQDALFGAEHGDEDAFRALAAYQ